MFIFLFIFILAQQTKQFITYSNFVMYFLHLNLKSNYSLTLQLFENLCSTIVQFNVDNTYHKFDLLKPSISWFHIFILYSHLISFSYPHSFFFSVSDISMVIQSYNSFVIIIYNDILIVPNLSLFILSFIVVFFHFSKNRQFNVLESFDEEEV